MDDSQGGVDDTNMNASPTVDVNVQDPKNKVKRRAQNREAQRRFRERNEQQMQVLHKKAEELRNDYQILLKKYTHAAGDVTGLIKENDMLRSDARNLRQQLSLVFAAFQRLQGRQLPENLSKDTFYFKDAKDYLEDLASGPLPI